MFNRTAASRELDAKLLDRFAPLIQEELRRRVFEGAKGGSVAPETMKSALQDSFVYFFGRTRTEHERRTYQQMASRLLRLLAIDYMRSGGRISQVGVSFPVIERWITLMEAQDPLGSRIVDLYYFGGCTVRETAATLGLSPYAVISDLRYQREHLQARIEGKTTRF